MLDVFKSFITSHHLFDENDKILLAVSGGVDSVAMVHLFKAADFQFGIAHCNFGLREKESDDDETFVRDLALSVKADFYSKHFNTIEFAKKKKISTQMAARELRYQWFETILKKMQYDFLATAHHKNDSLETILLNLTKGTGIEGLRGILPKVNKVIRPLLFANKEMIKDYVTDRNLPWREDSSNQSSKYQRNLIRNEVIPILKNINPQLESTIENTIERLMATEQIFDQSIKVAKEEVCHKKGEDWLIDITKLLDKPGVIVLLYELIKPFDFNFAQARDVLTVLRSEEPAGRIFYSSTHRLNTDRSFIIISPVNDGLTIDKEIGFGLKQFECSQLKLKISQDLEKDQYDILKDRDVASFDQKKLNFPLKLRKWKEGDWFFPLGMNHKKKLSDFMINEKIPLNLKERILVLTSDEQIIWVVGYRIDDRFKITASTQHIYELKKIPYDQPF